MRSSEKKLRALSEGADPETERIGTEFMAQVVRVLRVHMTHKIDNQGARRVADEFLAVVNQLIEGFSELQLQCVAEKLYFNGSFIKLSGGAFESAAHARKIFKRLAICEIAFQQSLDAASLREFLSQFQDCYLSDEPARFSKLKFRRITVRGLGESKAIGIDRRMELARTYAQLIVLVQDAGEALAAMRRVAVPQMRRALQQLVEVSEGQENLLAGLTRFDNPDGDGAMHAVAVTALSVLMGRRLELARKELISLGLAALFHDVGSVVTRRSGSVKPHDADLNRSALESVLLISRFTGSAEALLRTTIAFEYGIPSSGDGSGVIPSSAARIVAVASRFDLMTNPAPPARGLRPDQALRLMLDHAGGHFDRRVLRLLISVVGIHPVGSLVRLSGERVAVVIAIPEDPVNSGRPTVKVIEERGRPTDYVLELAKEPKSVEILEVVDARTENTNVTHYLLA